MRLHYYLVESQQITIDIKPIAKCTKEEIDAFFLMVDEAGQSYSSRSDILENGIYLGFAYISNLIAGVAAIKEPYRKDDVFDAAEIDPDECDADDYDYELGWAYTDPKYQKKGINTMLYKALLNKVKGHGVFATVRSNNLASINGLKKMGFVQIGKEVDMSVFDIVLLVKPSA